MKEILRLWNRLNIKVYNKVKRRMRHDGDDVLERIFDLMPDLKRGEEKRTVCPRCNGDNKALWSRSDYNGHLWCVCDDCGVIIRQ